MALILAVNPGNRHSPTLARLARELPGCELIGAESAAVAIKAIKKRVPDLLLLPAATARGEADLLAHLRTIPGGVLTLKLPAVEKADPIDLARQIREMLTGVPAVLSSPSPVRVQPPPPPTARVQPPSPFPARVQTPPPAPIPVPVIEETPPSHLVEAAETAVSWIRARRAQWSEPIEISELQEPYSADEPYATHEPHATYEPDATHAPNVTHTPHVTHEPHETQKGPDEPKYYEPIGPYEALELPEHVEEPAPASPPRGRLPVYAGAAAALVAVVAAAIMFWPRSSGTGAEPASDANAASQTATQEPAPPAAAPAPPTAEPPKPETGWVSIVVPFDVSITEEGQPVALDDQKRVALPPGRHRLRLQNVERGYDATRTVQVRTAETITLTLTPETTLAVTSNEPAEVLIDGTRAGDTPFEGRVPLGPHTVTVKTAAAERQLTIEATSKPIQLEVDFSKP